ncbi:MAG: CCA tRNA nucleotidyltransferase [Bacillota bacterium]|jgi:tRNA nucleotidyltransferase (CCA-adding enzyme)
MKIEAPNRIEYILNLFFEAGFEAFAVGGCVRDSLLGKIPHDWDITTNARPQQIKEILKNFQTIDTGIRYGTVTLLYEGETVEITTYRLDMGYDDNRHPKDVKFSQSLREDLSRRDFTVNAMAYNRRSGLIDEFGGLEDLRNGIVRTVGSAEQRFAEDSLRILRGLRFAAVLGFEIHRETADAIHSCRSLLANIAGERINKEFTALLLAEDPARILREYFDVIGVFIPELPLLAGLQQNNPYHAYDVFEHTMKALEHTPAEKNIRYAVLFHDFGKAFTKSTDQEGIDHFRNHPAVSERKAELIMQRLKFSNREISRICLLIKYHDTPLLCDEYHLKRWLNRFGEDFIRDLLAVKKADIRGQNPKLLHRLQELPKYYALLEKIKHEEQCFKISDLAVSGDDLLKIGYKPNRRLGKVMEHLLDEVMRGNVPNEKEALMQKAKLFK